MKSTVSADAAATLAAVNAALRRHSDLHWSDPEFLAWERGQVFAGPPQRVSAPGAGYAEGLETVRYRPGPDCERGVSEQPLIQFRPGHDEACPTCRGIPVELRVQQRVFASHYPPPEQTVHGPLMLGPEPDTVHSDPEPDGTATVTVEFDIERYRPVAEEVAW